MPNEEPFILEKKTTAPDPVSPTVPELKDSAEPEVIMLPEYERVLEEIEKGTPVIFVTGKAGTGKSTMIGVLKKLVPSCALVAPTGIAAINIGGVTIHSFFQFPLTILDPSATYKVSKKKGTVIQEIGALIVDEVSMVTPDKIDCINNALRTFRRDDRPFGGVPVIFVGDLHQLPPVIDDGQAAAEFYTHRYLSPYFFEADIFKKENVPLKFVELTRVFRQEDQDFVETLSRIRIGVNHRDAVARINRECHRDRLPPKDYSLYLVTTNNAAWAINRENIDALPTELFSFPGVIEGQFKPGVDRLAAPNPLELKVGAQVIFVKNNRPFWVNGTMGKVVDVSEKIIRVQIANSPSTVDVQRAVWEQMDSVYDPVAGRVISKVVGTYCQFPLALGWAITIHKAQGMTLQSVRIDLGNGAFASGQTYVALSRSKTMGGIYLDEGISMKSVIVDERIVEFYRRMRAGEDI